MNENNLYDYVVIGAGPAGIGFVNAIEENLGIKIALIDAGDEMENRRCKILDNRSCHNCNIRTCPMICGVGGASLLGGHKISCFPAGTFLEGIMAKEFPNSDYYQALLERLSAVIKLKMPNIDPVGIENGRLLYERLGYKFKYYTSYLCNIENLKLGYKFLLRPKKNVDMFFNTRVLTCQKSRNGYQVLVNRFNRRENIQTKKLVFATGRSGTNLLSELNDLFLLGGTANHMEIGVRIEFPANIFESIDQYHNDLKLLRKNIRTFCVSKKGKLSPYYCNGLYIVDGFYDLIQPTEFTNLALMYRMKKSPENFRIFSKIRENMKKKYNLVPIIQDYLSLSGGSKRCAISTINSSISFLKKGSILDIYPACIYKPLIKEIDYFVRSFFNEDDYDKINIIAPALEYYWLDFPINEDFSVGENIYMIGDCSGKYRGILQAFVAGAILGYKISSNLN